MKLLINVIVEFFSNKEFSFNLNILTITDFDFQRITYKLNIVYFC